MYGTNPMRQSMRTPAMQQGVIAKKAHMDWVHVEEAMRNGEDGAVADKCYPSGAKDVHHDIMPGDIIIAFKNVRNDSAGFNELGFTALNGMDTNRYMDHREMEDDVYFVGIATTEYRVSDPMGDSRAQDPDSGFAMVGMGTATTVNNGPQPLYPNNFVAVRFPQSYLNMNLPADENEIKFGKPNHLARPGQFMGKIQPVLVPFDYSDFGVHYDSAHALMTIPQSNGGIKDMSFEEMLRRRVSYAGDGARMSGAQEEAMGHFWSTLNMILAITESFTDATTIGQIKAKFAPLADATTPGDIAKRPAAQLEVANIFRRAYYTSVSGGKDEVTKAGATRPGEAGPGAEKLRKLGSTLHSGHVMGNWFSKASKVIGRVSELSLPGETANIVLGHASFI